MCPITNKHSRVNRSRSVRTVISIKYTSKIEQDSYNNRIEWISNPVYKLAGRMPIRIRRVYSICIFSIRQCLHTRHRMALMVYFPSVAAASSFALLLLFFLVCLGARSTSRGNDVAFNINQRGLYEDFYKNVYFHNACF